MVSIPALLSKSSVLMLPSLLSLLYHCHGDQLSPHLLYWPYLIDFKKHILISLKVGVCPKIALLAVHKKKKWWSYGQCHLLFDKIWYIFSTEHPLNSMLINHNGFSTSLLGWGTNISNTNNKIEFLTFPSSPSQQLVIPSLQLFRWKFWHHPWSLDFFLNLHPIYQPVLLTGLKGNENIPCWSTTTILIQGILVFYLDYCHHFFTGPLLLCPLHSPLRGGQGPSRPSCL